MKIRIFSDVKVNFNNSEDILKKNVIYKLEFPNNKIYIGQTSETLKERLRNHCRESFQRESHLPKARAIRKYLEFKVEVLYQGEDLNEKEIEFIKLYDSQNKEVGYNLTAGGGSLSIPCSEEKKMKISKANKGKNLGKDNHFAKSVIITNLETLEDFTFGSVMDGCRELNLSKSSIYKILTERPNSVTTQKETGIKFSAKYN